MSNNTVLLYAISFAGDVMCDGAELNHFNLYYLYILDFY